jgi:endonuclease/exonuclease/phosphatase family metal-dependent hydrolase
MSRLVLQTWNCFGAAQNAFAVLRRKGPPDAHRFGHPQLRRVLEEADIVCFQEVFLSDVEHFFDGLVHGHKHRDHNLSTWWPLTFGGSGLGIASRFPILERVLRPFRRPHAGAERFARKGMLHARVQVAGETGAPPFEVDVVTTHLQAGYSAGARSIRERQLREIRMLVDEVGSADRSFVVCGDLNIDGLRPAREAGEYVALTRTLSDFRDVGADDDHATFHPHPEINALAHRFEAGSPQQRIDYVLFRPPRTNGVAIEACELVLHTPLDAGGPAPTFASDHFGLRVVLRAYAPDALLPK